MNNFKGLNTINSFPMSNNEASSSKTNDKESGLNKSKSWENLERKQPHRAAKRVINYKETRTYTKIQVGEDIDFSRRSTLTPRSPTTVQQNFEQGEISDNSEIEDSEVSFKAVTPQNQSSPNSVVNSDKEELHIEEDFLSTENNIDKTLHLKTPLKAKAVEPSSSKEITNQNQTLTKINLFSKNNATSDIAKSLGLGQSESISSQELVNRRNSENFQEEIDLNLGQNNTGRRNNEILGEIIENIDNEQNNTAIMADMWLKMAKQVPDISSTDTPDKIYEAVGKLRQYGKMVPGEQLESFFNQISGKVDSEMRKYILKTENLKTVDDLCDLLEEKFVSKGSYMKNFEELQTIKKRKGETFTNFGKRIIKLKELSDKQYLFRHKNDSNIRGSPDLEYIALNSFMKYIRTCPALLIAIGNPVNVQVALDAVEKYEPDLDIAVIDDEPLKPVVAQTNCFTKKLIGCQKCTNLGHEAFYCPATNCIYCTSSMHKSAECNEIPTEYKINVICKECRGPSHTIDTCPQRDSEDTYCQYCQAANSHKANVCEVAINFTRQNDMNNRFKSLTLSNENKGMEAARWVARQAAGQSQGNKACYICGDVRHLANQCPKRGNQNSQRGFGRGFHQGGFNGNKGQNFTPNQNRNYNQNYNQNFNASRGNRNYNGNFHRNGHFGQANFRGRGNARMPTYQHFPQNFGNFPNMAEHQMYQNNFDHPGYMSTSNFGPWSNPFYQNQPTQALTNNPFYQTQPPRAITNNAGKTPNPTVAMAESTSGN